MSVRQAKQLEALERTLRNPSEEPVSISYPALETITKDFSVEIGRGGFGVVYLGYLPAGGKIAVKKLSSSQDFDDKLFMDEVNCLLRAKHDNIVRFLGYCVDTQGKVIRHGEKSVLVDVRQRFMCFEYVPNGNLYEYLKGKPNRDEWHTRYQMIRGICHGLNYLHEEFINHLDLKPQNIMLDNQMKPKITDFGLSRTFDEGQSRVFTQNISGTPGYIPPEGINHGEISFKTDIFSLGIIIIKLLTGDNKFDIENWQNLLDVDGPEAKICITIAQACLHDDQHKRPTIGKIIHDLNELQNVISETRNHTSSLRHQGHTDDEKDKRPSIDEITDKLNKMVPPPGTSIHQTLMTNKLLDVYPNKLRFPFFKPNGLISSPLRLTNKTDAAVAFRLLPAARESHIGLELHGILPPSSTRTYLLRMEKQPPAGLHEFMITLECCMADECIAEEDFDDHFSPENPDCNELHEEALMAVIGVGEMTKVVCILDQSERIISMDVHPTEPWILAGHYDGRVTMWNYNTQEKVMELKVASWLVGAVAFIAREQWLLAGDVEGKIHVHAYNTKEHVKTFEAHVDNGSAATVYQLSAHPSKPLLLSGSGHTGIIKLWDWTHNWKRIRTYKAHDSYVGRVMFDPMDSNAFLSTGLDCKIKFWKTGTARCTKEVDCEESQVCVDYFQPPGADRRYMITGCSSGRARIWDLETYTCIRTIEGLQGSNAYLPDHQLLVAALSDNTISLYNFSTEGWCDNVIDFKLGKAVSFAYVDSIKSVAIAFDGGIAMMEIN